MSKIVDLKGSALSGAQRWYTSIESELNEHCGKPKFTRNSDPTNLRNPIQKVLRINILQLLKPGLLRMLHNLFKLDWFVSVPICQLTTFELLLSSYIRWPRKKERPQRHAENGRALLDTGTTFKRNAIAKLETQQTGECWQKYNGRANIFSA